jgi:hypothetical protein
MPRSAYQYWTSLSYQQWEERASNIALAKFDSSATTYVYPIWASEEWVPLLENRFAVTFILFQPINLSYFEIIYRGNSSSEADSRDRRSYIVYQYMKSKMERHKDLKMIFKFDNNHSRKLLQKRVYSRYLY